MERTPWATFTAEFCHVTAGKAQVLYWWLLVLVLHAGSCTSVIGTLYGAEAILIPPVLSHL